MPELPVQTGKVWVTHELNSELKLIFESVELVCHVVENNGRVAKDKIDQSINLRTKWRQLSVLANERSDHISMLHSGSKGELVTQLWPCAQRTRPSGTTCGAVGLWNRG